MHCSLHGQRWLLLILLSCVAVASADPVLVWDGPPTLIDDFEDGGGLFGEPGVSSITNGIEVSAGCFIYQGICLTGFEADQNFTVTSPGIFVLSTTITAGGQSYNCVPGDCPFWPSAEVDVSYGGDTAILGSSVYQPIYDSGSNTSTASTCDSYGFCVAYMSLNDAWTGSVYLADGDYTLEEEYDFQVAGGEPTANAYFDSTLVPGVPEPRGGIAFLGVAFLIALGLKAHRTIKVQ
jgi:hypothetical protein